MVSNRIRDYDEDSPNIGESFGELAHDITVLAELQTRLFTLDIQESISRLILPLVLAVLGLCSILGCFPVLLFAAAYAIHAAGLELYWCFLISSGIGLLLGGAMLCGFWVFIRRALGAMNRSREAFSKNITWLRSVLKSRKNQSQPNNAVS